MRSGEAHVLRECIDKLETRVRRLAAVVGVQRALLRVSGVSLAEARLPAGSAKATVLWAVARARRTLPLIAILRILRVLPARYHAWQGYVRAVGLSAPKDQRDRLGALPLHFAQRFGWPELTAAVAEAYRMLTPEERRRVGVLTYRYHEAGAIDVFGRAEGLPYAIAPHNNYWLWGPGDYTGEVMLVVSDSEASLTGIFEQVFTPPGVGEPGRVAVR